MARPLRVEFEEAIYHLCARGNGRQRIFYDERDRARFVELLGESARRFDGAILCLRFSKGSAILRPAFGTSRRSQGTAVISSRLP